MKENTDDDDNEDKRCVANACVERKENKTNLPYSEEKKKH